MLGGFDILMSQEVQVKKIHAFQGCAKMVCFPALPYTALTGPSNEPLITFDHQNKLICP